MDSQDGTKKEAPGLVIPGKWKNASVCLEGQAEPPKSISVALAQSIVFLRLLVYP